MTEVGSDAQRLTELKQAGVDPLHVTRIAHHLLLVYCVQRAIPVLNRRNRWANMTPMGHTRAKKPGTRLASALATSIISSQESEEARTDNGLLRCIEPSDSRGWGRREESTS